MTYLCKGLKGKGSEDIKYCCGELAQQFAVRSKTMHFCVFVELHVPVKYTKLLIDENNVFILNLYHPQQ